MGTQTSFKGASDRPGLLPKWALLPPDTLPIPVEPLPPPTNPDQPIPPPPIWPKRPWQSAKVRLGGAVKASGRGNSFRKAGRAYVRALGGSRGAASSARSGRKSTTQLGGFLATAAKRGLGEALRELKLSALVGRDVDTVFSGLVNAIGPAGDSREEIAARAAISEALCFLYEKIAKNEADAEGAFSALDEDLVREAIIVSVTAYVYERWIVELGRQFEVKAVTAAQAVRLEGQMRQYVREAIKVDLQDKDVLEMNWRSNDGRALVQRIYEDAYAFIGGSK